jgi:hypothetical protein
VNDPSLSIAFQPEWAPTSAAAGGQRGLFSADARVKTLLKVLASYPEVRYILPDRISLDTSASVSLLEAVARFLERQSWLVKRVSVG